MLFLIGGGLLCVFLFLLVVYWYAFNAGKDAVVKKGMEEALKDVEEVKKRDLKHINDRIADVDKRLLKDTRD